MTEPADVIKMIGTMLEREGFTGRGRHWRFGMDGDEVLWLMQLEKVPRRRAVGLYLGADLPSVVPGPRPERGNDCKLVLYPDSRRGLVGVDPARFRPALDLEIELSDEDRWASISEGLQEIGTFVRSHRTVADLGRAYREGAFKGFPITLVIQDLLERAGR